MSASHLWGPCIDVPSAPDGWSRDAWQVALYARAADAVHRADDLGVQVKGWPSNREAERFFSGQIELVNAGDIVGPGGA